MQIDSVQQRPADLSEIALNGAACAPTIAGGIAEKAAAAPVQFTTDTSIKFAGFDFAALYSIAQSATYSAGSGALFGS